MFVDSWLINSILKIKNFREGCSGRATVSPGKTNLLSQSVHTCFRLSNDELSVKMATQDLKEKIVDPQNAGMSVQSLYDAMQTKLVSDKGISYETLSQVLKPFNKIASGLYKAKSSVFPAQQIG